MTKNEFLKKLTRALGGMSEQEKEEILADYREHFSVGEERGNTEQEISESLGNPMSIGKAYRVDFYLAGAGKREKPVRNIVKAVFTAVSLSLVNAIIILAPFIGLLAVVISLWAAAAAMALGGLAGIIGAAAGPYLQFFSLSIPGGTERVFLILGSVGISSLGCLMGVGMAFVTRMFFRVTGKYVKLNIEIVRRKKEGDNR